MTSIFEGQPPKTRPKFQSKQGAPFGFQVGLWDPFQMVYFHGFLNEGGIRSLLTIPGSPSSFWMLEDLGMILGPLGIGILGVHGNSWSSWEFLEFMISTNPMLMTPCIRVMGARPPSPTSPKPKTWRIIPVSHENTPFGRGPTTPGIGDFLFTMLINHLRPSWDGPPSPYLTTNLELLWSFKNDCNPLFRVNAYWVVAVV